MPWHQGTRSDADLTNVSGRSHLPVPAWGAHGVAEVLVVDYLKRFVQLLDAITGEPLGHSSVLDIAAAVLHPWR